MTRLVLIRHGTTLLNQQQRYCGRKDIGLSQEGRLQAKRLSREIKNIKFDRIFSSDLKRARQTAQIVFKGRAIRKVKGLREINFGEIEGLRHSEILRIYGAAYKKWLKQPFANHLPKAEKLGDFKKRVSAAICRIIRRSNGKTVAVVCHGGTIGVLVSSILRKRDFWQYVPKAASVTIVEYAKRKMRLVKFNDDSYSGRGKKRQKPLGRGDGRKI